MTSGKNDKPTFSIEELMHGEQKSVGARPTKGGELHLTADTRRIALFILLAVASFVVVYWLSRPGDDLQTQLRFDDTVPTSAIGVSTSSPAATPSTTTNGNQNVSTTVRYAYNPTPYVPANANGNVYYAYGSGTVLLGNANTNGIIRNAANTATPTPYYYNSIPVPTTVPSFTPIPTLTPTPEPTSTPVSYPVVMDQTTPTPSLSSERKRETAASGPAAWWLAFLPAVVIGVFRAWKRNV